MAAAQVNHTRADLNDNGWSKVKRIFDAAIDLDTAEREKFVEETCAGDIGLREKVEALLGSYRSTFLETPPFEPSNSLRNSKPSLIGRYEVLELIGVGGMGEVYLALDATLERNVALKMFSAELASNDVHISRFVREARSASALNHPNICTIYEINAEHQPPYIAMEYIDGETLAAKIRSGKLEPANAVDLVLQVADGVAEAHEAGIVHRDIKPANIIINKRGQVKIVDFGLAKRVRAAETDHTQRQLTGSGMIVGTVSYMSPEQARGQSVDASSDIWSLGVVLCEAVTGRLPFSGGSTGDIIASILRSEPAIGDSGEMPAELRTVIEKALSKDKGSRFQTAREFAAELEKAKANIHRYAATPDAVTAILPKQTEDLHHKTRPIHAKNRLKIAAGLSVVVLAAAASGLWRSGYLGAGEKPIESVAVMPFENESGSSDADYLGDGLTESLIGRLSTLPGLSVKARSSVFRYKGKNPDAKTVGDDLKVKAVLTGRIVKRSNDFTLYVDLVDAETENVLWKGEYNRPIDKLVAVQSDIVRDVISNLRVKLTGAEVNEATRNYTENVQAYQLYLKGRYYWDKRDEENYRVAEEAYNQAIALDPKYALAYAGLADCYLFREIGLGRDIAMPKAKEYALKALEIDDSLAEAHTTLAFVQSNYELDLSSGEREFKRAIELKPNYAIAHQFYGSLLAATGRTDEALAEMRKAVDLEPYSAAINWSLGMGLGFARRYDESIAQLQKTLQLQPGYALAEGNLTGIFIQAGRYDEAMVLVQKHLSIPERRDGALSNLAIIYAKTGRAAEARTVLDSLFADGKSQNNPYNIARVYAALGETDKAIDLLNKAIERRSFSVWFLRVDPFFDQLHDDARFKEILRRIGLQNQL